MTTILLDALKSLKADIGSGLAVWNGNHYYFDEKGKQAIVAEIDGLIKTNDHE